MESGQCEIERTEQLQVGSLDPQDDVGEFAQEVIAYQSTRFASQHSSIRLACTKPPWPKLVAVEQHRL